MLDFPMMRPHLARAPDDAPRLTLEEWAALPEDEPGELVDDRLVEEEAPDLLHELVVGWFVQVLSNWGDDHGALVVPSNLKIAVADRRGRMPDAAVYLPDRPRPPLRGLVRVPPDIALEVVSPTPRDGRRDRVEKLEEYAAFGVRWYWIVDPEFRTLEVLALGDDGRYVHALSADSGTLTDLPGCEGLALDLDALWHKVDRL